MNKTKLICDLCAIIDQQNLIIQAQAMELAQLSADPMVAEIASVRQAYVDAMGAPTEREA
ncbi:MAG: hypothetical protein RR350_02345 [Oscillibacter sp.]